MNTLCKTLALLLFSAFVQAQEFQASSNKAQLVELFTSQGCSSCPSAEKWLNSFKDDPNLWVETFPLAWHVTYWDDLGWRDRFSNPLANYRQYRYHHQGVTSGVYTPQAVINNQEWRELLARHKPPLPNNESDNQASLKIRLADKTFHAESNQQDALLNIALLGMGYKINIKRGENSGRTLEEEFVVLGYQQYLQHELTWQGELPSTKDDIPADAAVIWLTLPGENTPFSITGGPLLPNEVLEAHP